MLKMNAAVEMFLSTRYEQNTKYNTVSWSIFMTEI